METRRESGKSLAGVFCDGRGARPQMVAWLALTESEQGNYVRHIRGLHQMLLTTHTGLDSCRAISPYQCCACFLQGNRSFKYMYMYTV